MRKGDLVRESGPMKLPYSAKTLPWATFIGPDFFTLSTNKAKSDRVMAKFRVLGGCHGGSPDSGTALSKR